MCRRLKTTEYSTSPHQTLEPVCQNVMTAEGVPLTCTGVAQVLPLSYHFGSAGSDLVQKGLVLASVVLDFLDIFPRSRCSLSRLLWSLQLNNSWASLKKMWRLAFDRHSYFEVFWGCLSSVYSVLILTRNRWKVFIGMSYAVSLKATLLHTLEGHFRAILSTLTVEVMSNMTSLSQFPQFWFTRWCFLFDNKSLLMNNV